MTKILRSRLVSAALLGLTLTAQAGATVTLDLDDGTGPVVDLEVGRSLHARIHGLASGQAVDVVVRDANGWPIVAVPAVADSAGDVDVAPLWVATGVVGCDPGTAVGPYRFSRLETALQMLPGSMVEAAVLDVQGVELVAVNVLLVAPSRPIGFPADASGCPRLRFQDAESVYWSVIGGTAGTSTDVTVTSCSGPVVEIRQQQPEGPTFTLSGQQVEVVLLWPGPATTPGGYRVVAVGDGDHWPLPSELGYGSVNSGLLVDDHSCPPPGGLP